MKRFDEVASLFSAPPTGSTPLGPKCFEAFANLRPEKDLLVLIATDGVPDSLPGFKRVLENRNKDRIFVSILACSDNESEIGYLNELDRNVSNLDVLDDYESERREIKKKSPDLYDSYTVGNHVARLFVGPVFPKYDKLDESSK